VGGASKQDSADGGWAKKGRSNKTDLVQKKLKKEAGGE